MDIVELLYKYQVFEERERKLKKEIGFFEAEEELEDLIVKIEQAKYDICDRKTKIQVDNEKMLRVKKKLYNKDEEMNIIMTSKKGEKRNIERRRNAQKLNIEKQKLEQDILELMKNIEKYSHEMLDAEKRKSILEKKLSKARKDNQQKIEDMKLELDEIKKNKAYIEKSIPQKELLKLELIKTSTKAQIAGVENDRCGGCHMDISLNLLKKLEKKEEVVYCENCGRHLYLVKKEEVDKVALC